MNIFSVGCSFTEGQGIGGREHSYSKHLSKKLDAYHFNFGEAGHSNKYIFRKSIELLKKWNKNDLLIIQWTNPFRDEIASNEGFLFYPPFSNFVSLGFLYGNNPMPELKKIGIEDKNDYDKKILKEKQNYLIDYCENFFNENYLIESSFCFQLSLFGLLESMNIKYIMFFGWEFQNVDKKYKDILNYTNDKFLKESFGEFTNTIGLEHPDKNAHIIWADFLYEKIKEFKYI